MIVSEPLIVTGSLISYCDDDDDDNYDYGDEADDGGHGYQDDDDLLTSVVVSQLQIVRCSVISHSRFFSDFDKKMDVSQNSHIVCFDI